MIAHSTDVRTGRACATPPRAALLAFSLALIAFSTLGVVKAALRKRYGTEKIRNELSLFYLGECVQRAEAALKVFVDEND